MAPNNKEKGGLSHSAQKKANAEGKKTQKAKGPSGDQNKKKQQDVQCPICKAVVKKVVDMKAHFDSKHPKETFDATKHAIPI